MMDTETQIQDDKKTDERPGGFSFKKLKKFKKPGKKMFWAWIAYQCIKGTTTASLIWFPLLYMWWTSGGHH